VRDDTAIKNLVFPTAAGPGRVAVVSCDDNERTNPVM